MAGVLHMHDVFGLHLDMGLGAQEVFSQSVRI